MDVEEKTDGYTDDKLLNRMYSIQKAKWRKWMKGKGWRTNHLK